MTKRKLLIIYGPTATGKTELGIKLAEKFNGEIISADSRQVYKGMDIGTGKDIYKSKIKYQKSKLQVTSRKRTCSKQANKKFTIGYYLVDNIPIWGLDIVNPDYTFNVGEYKQIAQRIISDIWQKGKLPIVVGGTGLYIKALLTPMDYVRIPPDVKLRKILRYYDITKLRKKLIKLDKDRLEKMNNSDRNNPRRLIRAIEIARYFKSYPLSVIARSVYTVSEATKQSQRLPRPFGARNDNLENKNTLLIGLNAPKEIIFKKISDRIKKRLAQGIVKEIEKLLAQGYSWNLPSMSGLGYKEFKPYFEKRESLETVLKKWQIDEQNYLKAQLVWFRKMSETKWFDISKPGFYTEVEKLVCKFLSLTKMT